MDKAILLTKLSKCEDTENPLYRCYLDATSNTFEEPFDAFNQYMEDLKFLSNTQYDFALLKQEAKKFDITRRDFRELCDMVCVLLGDCINELCKYSTIVTEPSRFEDYCPFASESFVVYGEVNDEVEYDGYMYKIIDTKLEETPYYIIHCSTIDL